MKLVIVIIAAVFATLTGATVAAATAPKAEIDSLDRLEEEIHLQVDTRLRGILAELQIG